MFLDFFYHLRSKKIPLTPSSYEDLLFVLQTYIEEGKTINGESFYRLAKHCLIKDVRYFDAYDGAFAEMFGDLINVDDSFKQKIQDWLETALKQNLSEERKEKALKILPEDLMKELEKRLQEQKERHDGGNHWLGTGGTSPFGHSGWNPGGLRVGGESQNKSALAVMGKRQFRDYRTDETLNLRQMKLALKELRLLQKHGRPELHMEKTIRKTCENAGEIELVMERARKNTLKAVLLMDVGGSMTPFASQVNKLFSATHQVNHFKEFKAYYFHNIFYDFVYHNHYLNESEATLIPDLYKRFNSETRLIIVGDGAMAPYELFSMNGENRFYYDTYGREKYQLKNSPLAIDRLKEIKEKFPKTVWLNPEKKEYWGGITTAAIKSIIPMYHLSLDGLKSSIEELL